MTYRVFPRAVAMAILAMQAAAPQYAADVVHLTLTDVVHLAISQNRALKIARLGEASISSAGAAETQRRDAPGAPFG